LIPLSIGIEVLEETAFDTCEIASFKRLLEIDSFIAFFNSQGKLVVLMVSSRTYKYILMNIEAVVGAVIM
jgi:hypothetical protein